MANKIDLKTLVGKCHVQSFVPGFLWEIGQVMSHGDTKYAPGNWQGGKEHPEEYIGALMRHVLRYWAGVKYDPETGLHHLAHAACSLMFLWFFDNGNIIPDRVCKCQVCLPQGGSVDTARVNYFAQQQSLLTPKDLASLTGQQK